MNKMILSRVLVSGVPILFVNDTNNIPGSLILKFKVAENIRTKGKNGAPDTEKTQFHPIALFGNSAATMAQFLRKGTPVNIDGHLNWYPIETKEVSANGKKITHDTYSISGMVELANGTIKGVVETINENQNALMAAGMLIPMGTPPLGEHLFKANKTGARQFDLQECYRTGKWGYADVWVKGQGKLGNKVAPGVVAPVTGIPAGVDMNALMSQMMAMFAAQNKPAQSAAPVTTAVDAATAIGAMEQELEGAEVSDVDLTGVEVAQNVI